MGDYVNKGSALGQRYTDRLRGEDPTVVIVVVERSGGGTDIFGNYHELLVVSYVCIVSVLDFFCHLSHAFVITQYNTRAAAAIIAVRL